MLNFTEGVTGFEDLIHYDGLGPNIKVHEIMDTASPTLCCEY